jgi:large subunit ribosomal protein L25
MEIATVQGETRQPGNRHASKHLRAKGLIPGVIYGHGEAPEHIALSQHDMALALEKSAHVINFKVGPQEKQYLVKDVQFDHLQKSPIHVDLMRVDVNERVRVSVPIEFRGTPVGVSEGGSLVHVLAELEIEALVLQIPDSIRVRVDGLAMNQSLPVSEIEVPENVKILNAPTDIVAVVQPPRAEAAPVAAAPVEGEATGAEPEVIAKGKAEEEEGAES